ncbi:hypothetical protein J4Q44_G00268930 [Coregonus suidteri]|uniref:Large ribosomal subunit protein mL37 n=1 Tax=Coregonus suidteri TaxID=861788 RepID=A0AAN8QLV1_9TELE
MEGAVSTGIDISMSPAAYVRRYRREKSRESRWTYPDSSALPMAIECTMSLGWQSPLSLPGCETGTTPLITMRRKRKRCHSIKRSLASYLTKGQTHLKVSGKHCGSLKSKLTKGLPDKVLSLSENAANQIENQDERVQNAIRHARFWDTTEERPPREKFCVALLRSLIHLCGSLQVSHPGLGRRIMAEKYSLAATWSRGEDLFQVRGQNGLLLNSMAPLPVLAGKEEVQSTADHVLETFYPISPTIDLQSVQVYEELNHTGFKEDYPYPHAHTLFLLEAGDTPVTLLPEQLRAKMIMFAFGNALARAQTLHGTKPGVLEKPIVVQSVATNGRMFQYVVFQLNTTDLQADEGVKNQVWVEDDQLLYDFAKVRPLIKKRVVQIPPGLSGYKPETFQKFLSLYLHGAV